MASLSILSTSSLLLLFLLEASASPLPTTSALLTPPDNKWRHPCAPSLSAERRSKPQHRLSANTHVDVYLWSLVSLSTEILPLLTSLSESRRPINFGADRVRQFQLPGMAPPRAPSSSSLTSAHLQRLDQEMARAAVYLQLYRRFARLHDQTAGQRLLLDRCLSLVYRSQCRVQLLHGVLFGGRTWASQQLSVASVVPLRWRDPNNPQSVKHLRNLVTANSTKRLFSAYRQMFLHFRARQQGI